MYYYYLVCVIFYVKPQEWLTWYLLHLWSFKGRNSYNSILIVFWSSTSLIIPLHDLAVGWLFLLCSTRNIEVTSKSNTIGKMKIQVLHWITHWLESHVLHLVFIFITKTIQRLLAFCIHKSTILYFKLLGRDVFENCSVAEICCRNFQVLERSHNVIVLSKIPWSTS